MALIRLLKFSGSLQAVRGHFSRLSWQRALCAQLIKQVLQSLCPVLQIAKASVLPQLLSQTSAEIE